MGSNATNKIISTYSVKIRNHQSNVFKQTIALYRDATDFFIDVILKEWDEISLINGSNARMTKVEHLTHKPSNRPIVEYDFDSMFYKFPSYLRRAAINEALGKVSSYKSSLEANPNTGKPKAGYIYPTMYKTNMFMHDNSCATVMKIKVFIRNTWDWIEVNMRKTDIDYITRHCGTKEECSPTLRKRGKQWFLDFPFKSKMKLNHTPVREQTIISVDLGLNSACVCAAMKSDGTVVGRQFLSLPAEEDSLNHALNRIKKAQQHGNLKTPRLWAKANGINDDIVSKTSRFIINMAIEYNADVIVFECLDIKGKKHGSKKQRLHLWKKQKVQKIVEHQAHELGIRISHICP